MKCWEAATGERIVGCVKQQEFIQKEAVLFDEQDEGGC